MVTITVHCPHCQSDALVRNGHAPMANSSLAVVPADGKAARIPLPTPIRKLAARKSCMPLHSDKHVCPRRRNPTALKTILSSRQTQRDGKAECRAEQSDGHPARCWGSRVASEPRLSTRGESGHVARGKESPPLCLAKVR